MKVAALQREIEREILDNNWQHGKEGYWKCCVSLATLRNRAEGSICSTCFEFPMLSCLSIYISGSTTCTRSVIPCRLTIPASHNFSQMRPTNSTISVIVEENTIIPNKPHLSQDFQLLAQLPSSCFHCETRAVSQLWTGDYTDIRFKHLQCPSAMITSDQDEPPHHKVSRTPCLERHARTAKILSP